MRKLRFGLCLALIALVSPAAAQTIEERHAFAQRLFSNLSDEAATCGAYFTVVSKCLANTTTQQSQDMSRNYNALADNAFIRALAYADMAEMKREAAIAAAKLAQEQMWQQIGNYCANIAILNLAHVDLCKAVMRDPDERAGYWLERLRQE